MRIFLLILIGWSSMVVYGEVPCASLHDKYLKTKVTGKIINARPDKKTIGIAINRVGFGQEDLESSIDNTGKFSFEFQTYVSTDVWLIYNTNFLLLINPGDSLHIQFDGNMNERPEVLGSVIFSGSGSGINNQISLFQKNYFNSSFYLNWELKERAVKNLSPDQFKLFIDSLKIQSKKYFDNFYVLQNFSKDGVRWMNAFIDHEFLKDLTFYPDSHRKALVLKPNEWSVDLSYYDYLKIQRPLEEWFYCGYSVSGFIDKFLYRYVRLRVIEQANRNGVIEIEQNMMDSLYVSNINLEKDSLLKEILLTRYFSDQLNENNLESFERNLPRLRTNVHSIFLIQPLIRKYKAVKAAIDEADLEFNPKLQFDLQSNTVIDEILAEYKGTPVYIDVWATWCGPCIEEFPYSNQLKAELKQVTFVYLCIDSQLNAFKNTVKKHRLEGSHYYFDTKKSERLRKEFNINEIPNYLLVDGNGKLLYNGYTLRPSEDKTKEEILRLLNRHD